MKASNLIYSEDIFSWKRLSEFTYLVEFLRDSLGDKLLNADKNAYFRNSWICLEIFKRFKVFKNFELLKIEKAIDGKPDFTIKNESGLDFSFEAVEAIIENNRNKNLIDFYSQPLLPLPDDFGFNEIFVVEGKLKEVIIKKTKSKYKSISSLAVYVNCGFLKGDGKIIERKKSVFSGLENEIKSALSVYKEIYFIWDSDSFYLNNKFKFIKHIPINSINL